MSQGFKDIQRLPRLFSHIKSLKCPSKSELILKSATICGLLVVNGCDKLQIEAGTLSYIPQFVAWSKEGIQENFGTDVTRLIDEVEDIRKLFLQDDPDEDLAQKFAYQAKNIYLHQWFLDALHIYDLPDVDIIVDGVSYVGEEGKVFVDNKWLEMQKFHQWILALLTWKLEMLEYEGVIVTNIQQLVENYRVQKGYILEVKDEDEGTV